MGRTSDAKERLMAAALDLIWEESYGCVTIDDICKRADVRKGSFYYFFPGKAELASHAIEEMWKSEWKPFLDKHLSPDIEPVERWRGYFTAAVAQQTRQAEQHGKVLGCPVCSMGNEVCTNQEVVSAAIREIFVRKRRYYESAIRDSIAAGVMDPCDPAEKATALFGLVDGLIGQARIMNDIKILNHLPQLGLELLKIKTPVATV
ncbi:MAG: TetR/AcrR family transcriptional regulator [Burkholderiales bacterium]|nr:TetR/AcrR family transcriptional regulator [Opitutaceae bacterium]